MYEYQQKKNYNWFDMLEVLKMFFFKQDVTSKHVKGYIHQLNKSTFGMYMYTETGNFSNYF